MKADAIIFVQPKEVQLGQAELPDPTPRDIIVQTEVSGVSVGTERWAYLGKRPELQFPNVPGYMAVGTITSSGAEATAKGWKTGDRVYYFATRFRGELEGKSWMGSHVSQGVVDVCGPRAAAGELGIHHCERVPKGLAPEDAVLTGLCAVAMRGIEMAVVPAATKVLVNGLGVIGQYALQVCQLKGAHVTGVDVVDSRLEIARTFGAEHVLHGTRDKLAEAAAKIAPGGFDIIIDTSSIAAVVNSLFPLLKFRGKFVFQGWYPPPAALDLDAMQARMPSGYFPCGTGAEAVETALDWAARGWLKSKPLITHTFSPREAAKVYGMIEAGSENFLGIVFDWRK